MRDRPGKRLAAQDTDLNFGVRENLLSEGRSLEQNDAVAKRIKNQYADYCVGQCNIKWNTGVPEIDKSWRKGWKAWKPIADFRGIHRFPKMMKLAAGDAFSAGDMFVQLVDSNSFLQVNMIEADRVSSSGIFNTDSDSMVGGIGLDPVTRRHKFIRVWERTLYGTFGNPIEIPISDYRHLFDPTRVDANRGVTGFHAVLNAMRDKKEINAAELAKTKRLSKIALLAKVMSGQAPVVSMMDDEVKQSQQGVTVEETSDGQSLYMFTTEDVKAMESNTPGSAWMGHMEFTIRHIAIGSNLPYGVVWNMAGLNKPAVLFELQQAARTIASFQDEIEARLIIPIAGAWLAKEIANKRQPFHPLWYEMKVGRPPYISIDAGRDSTAAQNENKLAMRSLKSWYMETEEDWDEEITQCVTERSWLEIECKRLGVDPNNVRMLQQTGASSVAPKDTGDAE